MESVINNLQSTRCELIVRELCMSLKQEAEISLDLGTGPFQSYASITCNHCAM